MRKRPNSPNIHSKRSTIAAPAKIKMLRSTNAPKMPQKSTSCWYLRSMPKKENSIRKTKRLSIDNDFSIK